MKPLTMGDAKRILLEKIIVHENFLLAYITTDYGEAICYEFHRGIVIDAPKNRNA